MDPSHLQELVELEDNYWWHVAKRKLVTRLLKKHCPPPGRLVDRLRVEQVQHFG